jgi:6-phosphogluconolactonase
MTAELEILADADAVAARAAAVVADAARSAIGAHGRFSFAVSGGRTPWAMFAHLAGMNVAWDRAVIFQVDERIAPDGDPERNLTNLKLSLPAAAQDGIRPMPVTAADADQAAAGYARGLPPAFDLVHLGLGPDGHTASLVPGDAVLEVTDRDVAVTAAYQGHRRMTLTFPVLDRARRVLWLVTGAEKVPMLARLRAGDRSIPAGRVSSERALILADAAAAAQSR